MLVDRERERMRRHILTIAMTLVSIWKSDGTECGSSMVDIPVNNTKIIFNSPDFPADYARPLSCKWMITASEGEVINYRIVLFDVFPSIFCLKDILEIFDGDNKYSPVLQAWCGTRPAGQTIQTSAQYSYVSFQAVTAGDNRQGFEFEVWSEKLYVPDDGRTDFGPVHMGLLAVFSLLGVLFLAYVIVIVVKERREQRLKEALDSVLYD